MSMSSLNLGVSFDEIISLFPGTLVNSQNHADNNDSENDLSNESDDEITEKINLNEQNDPLQDSLQANINAYHVNKKQKNFVLNFKKKASPPSSSSDQAFLNAIYNTIGIAILVACVALCILLYIVLQAFIRPILWAILTSAFLFSFKRYMTDLTRNHLEKIEKNNNTLAMELFLLPFKTLDFLVDYIWTFITCKYRHLIALVLTLVVFHLSGSFYQSIFYLCKASLIYIQTLTYFIAYNFIIDYYSTWQFALTLVIAYLVAIMFYWHERYTAFFQILSLPVWLSLLLLGSKLMGTYRPWFMLGFFFLICMGSYSIMYEFFQKHRSKFRLRKLSPAKKVKTDSIVEEENDKSNCESLGANLEKDETGDESLDAVECENDGLTNVHNISMSSTNSSTTQTPNNSFLKTTLLNLYQTSIYYFNTSLNSKNSTMIPNDSQSTTTNNNRNNANNLRRKKENSDKYFIGLFWLFLCVKLRYDFYVAIPFLVVVWKLLRHFFLFVFNLIANNQKCRQYWSMFKVWIETRKDVLAPRPFQVLLKLFKKGDHKVNQLLKDSLDNLMSALMIFSLILVLLTALIILIMKVQSESVQLVSILSNILNENLYSKPELKEWLPEKEKLNKIYQTSINNFYFYGREWLSKTLRSNYLFDTANLNNKSDYMILEAQILEQWDNLYAYLSQKATLKSHNSTFNLFNRTNVLSVTLAPPSNTSRQLLNNSFSFLHGRNSVSTQTESRMSARKNLFDLFKYKHLVLIVKDNLGILMSVLDSLYMIIKGNINLLSTIIYTVISTIFSSGFALMNFFFSFIVYMTALFYLLSMSGSRFKPLQVLTEINFFRNSSSNKNETKIISRGHLLSRAIEESIRSVFVASLKMAAFFGLYTYLINCLFGLNIIYLPSIISALFAVLPLIGTYWFCIPGVLELWLIYDSILMAIFFIFMHLLPYILSVDRAIYSEIKGGHPYLTGLAFAGGVYCLGLEGAIIGPIILCLFIVISKIITSATASNMRSSGNLGGLTQLLKTPSSEK